jgi:hypothetical protein
MLPAVRRGVARFGTRKQARGREDTFGGLGHSDVERRGDGLVSDGDS